VRGLQFDFRASEARVFVLRSTNYLAALWYAPAKDKPAFLCTFDFDRKVVSHRIGIATRSGADLPQFILGVEAVRVDSGVLGATTNLLSGESLLSLVRDLVKEQNVNIDFSQQETGIAVDPDHRSLQVFTTFFNKHRADIMCQVDFDRHVTVTWISPELSNKGLELTPDGKLRRTKANNGE
jgi:hypothetical protein